jgi:hypothetical protein
MASNPNQQGGRVTSPPNPGPGMPARTPRHDGPGPDHRGLPQRTGPVQPGQTGTEAPTHTYPSR